MLPRPFVVTRRRRETADTWTLELEPVGGESLEILPGQFTMLYRFGVGEVPISVSGDLSGAGPLVHTVRSVGAVTEAICSTRPGETLGVRGPFGNSWPVEEAVGRDVVVVAGGIGLAPLRPVLYHVLAHRREYGRLVLLYGARTPEDRLYVHELERWRGRPDVYVDQIVDSASGDWAGKVGVVTKLLDRAPFDLDQTTAMICGPEIMMRFVVQGLVEQGLGTEDCYVSMERNMRCGVGLCGHCQLGPTLICRDGAVYGWNEVEALLGVREL